MKRWMWVGLIVLLVGLVVKVRAGYDVKVMVIDFEPGTVRQDNRWNDPQVLEGQFITDVKNVSGGEGNYRIVDRVVVNDFPVKIDGFKYTIDSFNTCWSNRSTCHSPDTADYLKILSDYDVCGKRNRGEIDELWLWGGPYFGYWEAIMTGPGAFWTNGGPLTGSTCQKQLNIMGFNYERGVSEMFEDLGHRVEGTMRHVYGSWTAGSDSHAWNKYTLLDKDAPGRAGCGNIHFAPNSTSDYDWGNTRTVTSSCEDWLNYPNLTGATQSFSCSKWGCDGYAYKKWWHSHLPKAAGTGPDGKLNNWWSYVFNYEGTTGTVATPTPTAIPTPTPTPTLTPTPAGSPTVSPTPTVKPKPTPRGKGRVKSEVTSPSPLLQKPLLVVLIDWIVTTVRQLFGGKIYG